MTIIEKLHSDPTAEKYSQRLKDFSWRMLTYPHRTQKEQSTIRNEFDNLYREISKYMQYTEKRKGLI